MTELWVADDGSYGTGKILRFDTAGWSEGDWEDFDAASDHFRLNVAIALDEKQERERNGQ